MPVNLAHSIGQHAVFVLKEAESHNELINGTVPGSGGTTATVAGKLAFVPDTNYTTWARNTPQLDAALGGIVYGFLVRRIDTFSDESTCLICERVRLAVRVARLGRRPI